jgi:spermidine synthase
MNETDPVITRLLHEKPMARYYALFFISGFAALIYQLLWFRHLGFIFGNTVQAASTVLTAFMTGLALGAHLFGRWARRTSAPIRLFGFLELGVGLYALCLPLLFDLLREAYRWAYGLAPDSLPLLTALRFVLAFILLLLPTTLMGGTLPVLVEGLTRSAQDFTRRIGFLYGINTLGAVTGIVAAGFFLIPWLGLAGTGWLAVVGNLLVGSAGIALGRHTRPTTENADDASADPSHDPVRATILVTLAVSGFVALALEVVWFRALVLIFGSTTYSFSAMLACFLAGIALGSLLFGAVARRFRHPLLMLAVAEAAIGAFTLASMHLFNTRGEFLLHFLVEHGFTWPTLLTAQFLITLGFLAVPTLLMGFAFPLAASVLRMHATDSAASIARVYTINTIGCVLGSFTAGFLLLPALGIETSLIVLGSSSLLLGVFVALRAEVRTPLRVTAAALFLLALALGWLRPPAWDHKVMSAGPHFSPWNYVNGTNLVFREKLAAQELVFYHEGITATISVTRSLDDSLAYCSGGKVEADTSPRSMMLQRVAGHLPMLFHPDPRRVLNIGLGAGVSLGALGCYPVDALEVAEIEPGAARVAEIFGPYNHHVMQHPALRVRITDGRNHLFATTNRYDVITSDPFEPVHAGANHLYTVDHFRQARARLKPGGIMSQYVPLYELSAEDYRTILRSFVTVFPESILFYTGEDTLILGFRDQVQLDPDLVRRKFAEIPAVRSSLADLGFERPETILGMFVADLRHAEGLTGGQHLNSDDHPVVEFSAPKSALNYTTFGTSRILLENFTALPPSFLDELSAADRTLLEGEHEGLRLTLEAQTRRAVGNEQATFEILAQAIQHAPHNPIIANELTTILSPAAEMALRGGDSAEATRLYQMILQLRPTDFWSLVQLVGLAMQQGDLQAGQTWVQQARQLYPNSPIVQGLFAKVQFTAGSREPALAAMQEAVRRMPWYRPLAEDLLLLARAANRSDLITEAEHLLGVLPKSD